jgi:tetratricopeptide (TPR) repeat protein/transglutaminase-like putative cysteine protease
MPGNVTRIAPMYSDIHEKHVTVKGLGIGDLLEYSVRYRRQKPDVPGQFWFEYSFEKTMIVKDEELELTVPRNKHVNISSPGAEPKIQDEGARRVYRWHAANLKHEQDPTGKQSKRDAVSPSVQVSTFHNWEEVGRWYGSVQAAQVTPTPAIRSKAAELTKGLTSDDQKVRALYNFVATRFHYVSLSFGTGRYEPHAADEVLDNEYGDCKDKHTLLAALLKAAGFDAWPALINTARKITPDVPSPGQFDHVITVIPRGASLVWLDTTPEVAPFGLLFANLRDKQALVIPTEKAPALMKTPPDPPFSSMQSFVAEGKLDADGTFKGHVERAARGDAEVLFRLGFRATSPAQWKDLVQRVSYASGFAGEVAAVTASPPGDTEKPFQFSYDYTRKEFGDWPNHRIIPPLPPLGIEASDEDNAKPTEPLFLGAPGDIVYRARVELPAGGSLTPPDKLDLITDYAEYHSQYGFEKGVFTAVRRFVIRKPEVPLSEWDSYLKFRKAIRDEEGYWINLAGLSASSKPAAVGLESEDADTLNTSGRAALDAQNYSLAADLLNKAVKINPRHKWAWNNLGLAYMGMLRFDDAVSALRKQIEASPNDPYAYNNLGRVLEFQGQHDEARQAFQRQIAINPQDRWAHANLGTLLLHQKKYDDAVHELEAAAAISDRDPATHAALGQTYLELGQVDKGLAALDKAVQIAPSPMLFNNVAYILAEKGERLDKARQFAESAISSLDGLLRDVHLKNLQAQHLSLVSLLAMTWDTLGWVYFQQGNLELAERYLQAAWSLSQHAAVADHLGQLYEKQDKKNIAAQFYAQAIAALHPPVQTRQRLIALAGGEKEADALINKARNDISKLRTTTVQVRRVKAHHATAEFFVSFLPGPKVDEVKFISGDDQLSEAIEALAAAKYDVVFPNDEATKIVRRGLLACPDAGSWCQFVLLLPNDVHSID